MSETAKGYNYCLDVIKGIACMFVVCMHCEFPGVMGTFVQCISRFCVPLFFMISGYYCYYENLKDEKPIGNKLLHILKITSGATVFYCAIAVIKEIILGGGSLGISLKGLAIWAIFNQPIVIAGQMWFLFALIYTYTFYAIIKRLDLIKLAYCSIPVFIVLYIAGAQGMYLLGHSLPNYFYRNWLIEGFPLFMLGHYIHNKQDSMKIKNSTLFVCVFASTVLCLIERYLLGRDFGVNIFTFPQVSALFLLAVRNPTFDIKSLRNIGKKDSMLVYIFHPAIWHGLEDIYMWIHIEGNMIALYLMPILVIVLSIIASRMYTILKMKTISLWGNSM